MKERDVKRLIETKTSKFQKGLLAEVYDKAGLWPAVELLIDQLGYTQAAKILGISFSHLAQIRYGNVLPNETIEAKVDDNLKKWFQDVSLMLDSKGIEIEI